MASFEELQALAEVVSKSKVKHIQVIGNPGNANTKFEQFYDALADGRLQNDEEASQFFYQSSPDHAAYRKLKDRLQERLVNTLFFVDVNQHSFNDHNRAYFTCCKQVAAAKILFGLNARQAAIPIAEEALKLALEFEFVEFIVSLVREIQMHYGTIIGDRKKFDQMDEILNRYTKVLNAEILAQKYYADIMSYYVTSKSTKPEIKDKVEIYADEIEELFEQVSSPRFNLYGELV